MLLLKTFNRFSVDIDILMKPDLQEKICNDVFTFKDNRFLKVEEDKRKPIDIIKRLEKEIKDNLIIKKYIQIG